MAAALSRAMKPLRPLLLLSALLTVSGCATSAPDDESSAEATGAASAVAPETRRAIMNALRAKLAPSMGGQSIVFDVSQGHFATSGSWVFLMGRVQLASGGEPSVRGTAFESASADGIFDGFRVEALLKVDDEGWSVIEYGVGTTDVWWDGIWQRYPEAPRQIFPGLEAPVVTQSERMAIMSGLREAVKPDLGNQDIVFDVSRGHFAAKDGWCWLKGNIQLRGGGAPTTRGTAYAGAAAEGLFDGFRIEALLKKDGARWRVLEHGIGTTDVWYVGISRKYPDAPRAIWDSMADMPE